MNMWSSARFDLTGAFRRTTRARCKLPPQGVAAALACLVSLLVSALASAAYPPESSTSAAWPEGLRCLWSRTLPLGDLDADEGFPFACLDGRLVVVTATNEFHAIDLQTGESRWAAPLKSQRAWAAGIGHSVAIAVVRPCTLCAFDLQDGESRWRFTAPADILKAAITAGTVLSVLANDTITGLKERTGEQLWTRPIDDAKKATVAADEGVVCLLLPDGHIRALNAETGDDLWEALVARPEGMFIAASGGRLVVASDDLKLRALDIHTGTPLWTAQLAASLAYMGASPNAVACYSHHGMFGLHVFDPSSGKLIGRESLSGGSFYSSGVVDGLLLAPRSSGDLLVFRLDQGYRCRTIGLPEEQFVIGTLPTSILFLSISGRLSRVEPSFQPLTAPQEKVFTKQRAVPLGVIATAIALVIGLGVVAAFAAVFASSPTIPPTHVSVVKYYACATGLAILAVTGGMGAFLIAGFGLPRSATATRCLALILLVLWTLLPLVANRLSVASLRWKLKRQRRTFDPLPADSAVTRTLDHLLDEMGIRGQVDVRCAMANSAPIALQTGHKQAMLVLPKNLPELTAGACQDPEASAGLLRLVLAHELAHIKSRDLKILPLMAVLRTTFFGITVLLWGVYAAASLQHDELLTTTLKPFLGYVSVSAVVLYVILLSAQRDRERIADATASLFVRPDILSKLTRPGGAGRPAALEQFLMGLTLWPSAPAYLGFRPPGRGLRHRLLAWMQSGIFARRQHLSEFRREVADRGEALVSKRLALSPIASPSLTVGLTAGALGAVFFAGLELLWRNGFMGVWFSMSPPGASAGLPNMLNAVDAWSHCMSSTRLHEGFDLLCGVLVGAVLAVFATWEFRDASARLGGVRAGPVGRIGLSIVGIFILTSMMEGFIGAFARPAFPTWPSMRLGTGKIFLATILITLLMFLFMSVRGPISQRRRLAVSCMAGLSVMGLCVAALWIALSRVLSPFGALVLVANAFCLTAFLHTLGLLKPLAADVPITREWLDYRRILWVRHVRTMWRDGPPPSLVHDGLEFAVITFAMFIAPATIVIALALPPLVEFDNWYLAHLGEIHESTNRFSDLSIEEVLALPRAVVFAKAFLADFVRAARPENAYPSTVLGGILLCAQFAVWLPVMALYGMFTSASSTAKLRVRLPLLCALAQTDNLPRVERFVRRNLKRLLRWRWFPRKPIKSASGIPLTRAVCEIMLVAHAFNECVPKAAAMAHWIRKCECLRGGFAVLPGAVPDILHTRYALRAIDALELPTQFPMDIHRAWILVELDRRRRMPEEYPPAVWLEDIDYLLDSLAAVQGHSRSSTLDLRELCDEAVRSWQAEGQSIAATFHLVSILSSLGANPSDGGKAGWIEAWLARHEPALQTLDPDRQMEIAWQMVRILQWADPQGYRHRPSVSQFLDNLVRCVPEDVPFRIRAAVERLFR